MSTIWFGLAAVLGIMVLTYVGRWYAAHQRMAASRPAVAPLKPAISRNRLIVAFPSSVRCC